jgi:hypothetical protein
MMLLTARSVVARNCCSLLANWASRLRRSLQATQAAWDARMQPSTAAADPLPVVIAALEAATHALRQLQDPDRRSAVLTPSPSPSPSIDEEAPLAPVAPSLASVIANVRATTEGAPRVVIALFDYTTLGLAPWQRRGYECHVRRRRRPSLQRNRSRLARAARVRSCVRRPRPTTCATQRARR